MKEGQVTVETELTLHRDVEKDYPDYLQDESRRQGCAEAICFPANTEEVVQALKIAAQHAWAVTLQGARTGITAGAVPDGGLIVSLDHMKKMRGVAGESGWQLSAPDRAGSEFGCPSACKYSISHLIPMGGMRNHWRHCTSFRLIQGHGSFSPDPTENNGYAGWHGGM